MERCWFLATVVCLYVCSKASDDGPGMAVAQLGQGSKRRALCRTGEKKESQINMHNPCLPLTASNHARDFASILSPTQVCF